jgi:hypothetical protein
MNSKDPVPKKPLVAPNQTSEINTGKGLLQIINAF